MGQVSSSTRRRNPSHEELLNYLFNDSNNEINPHKKFAQNGNRYLDLEDFVRHTPKDMVSERSQRSKSLIKECRRGTRFVCKDEPIKRGICVEMFVKYWQNPKTSKTEHILSVILKLDCQRDGRPCSPEIEQAFCFEDLIPEKEYLISLLPTDELSMVSTPISYGTDSFCHDKGVLQKKKRKDVLITVNETVTTENVGKSNFQTTNTTAATQLEINDDVANLTPQSQFESSGIDLDGTRGSDYYNKVPSVLSNTKRSNDAESSAKKNKRSKKLSGVKSSAFGNAKVSLSQTQSQRDTGIKLYSVSQEDDTEINYYKSGSTQVQNANKRLHEKRPIVSQKYRPEIEFKDEISCKSYVGDYRGIEGNNNSCYLDSLLFSWFYKTNIFDSVLFHENTQDSDLAKQIRKILKTDIADPLRNQLYCSALQVQNLRSSLANKNPKIKGEMMDAEELLYLILENVLNAEGFISYEDTSDFMHQLNISPEMYPGIESITAQKCLKNSLQVWGDLTFKRIPYPALLLAIPRSDGELVHFKMVIPNRSLDLSAMIADECPCSSDSCKNVALWECINCFKQGDRFFVCEKCSDKPQDDHQAKFSHEVKLISTKWMDLNAVICIRSLHYVAFVKSTFMKDHKLIKEWLFFDSMAGPSSKVEIVSGMDEYLEALESNHESSLISKYYVEDVFGLKRRIITDCHICIYENRLK